MEPVELPTRDPDSGDGATQLSLLLDSVTSMTEEEFKRSERLDGKARNQITIAGTYFAVVQAVVIGLINGSLGGGAHHPRSSFVLWLAIVGAVAAAAIASALFLSNDAWRLRKESILEAATIRAYIQQARSGNVLVGVKLVEGFSTVLDDRRALNEERATTVEVAGVVCGIALAFASLELILSFIAVALK